MQLFQSWINFSWAPSVGPLARTNAGLSDATPSELKGVAADIQSALSVLKIQRINGWKWFRGTEAGDATPLELDEFFLGIQHRSSGEGLRWAE